MSNQTVLNSFADKLKTVVNKNEVESIKLNPGDAISNNNYLVLGTLSINTGEADLYRVLDIKHSTECVLKLYRRKSAVKEEIIDKLSHTHNPNIAELLDKGIIRGCQYIVIPYYKNNSLGSYIEQGVRFSVAELKALIIPSIINGLKTIHDLGIIHKDLKPSNLMVSNDQAHIILIDFGISSITNGNTVVVTQTGKSPFYSAPETNTGLFLTDSDYYSLGITLYELVTGNNPFHNTKIEHVAGLMQIQNIPFPDDFDKDLKILIEGLTYKDISNRNDKSNPNRRWGYEEVQKWLKGEKLPIPGQNTNVLSKNKVEIKNNGSPYMFNGEIYYDNKNLIEALLTYWDMGKQSLFRGFLSRHYELSKDQFSQDICEQAENLYNTDHNNDELAFMHAMYLLEPTITKLYWHGLVFENITTYATALLDELSNNAPNEQFISSAQNMLKTGVLKSYVKLKQQENKNQYLEIIRNNTDLLALKSISTIDIAIRLGNSLLGRDAIKVGNHFFKSFLDFKAFMEDLYANDLIAYKNFCTTNKNDLLDQEYISTNISIKEQIRSFIGKGSDAICFDKLVFNDFKFLEAYVTALAEDVKAKFIQEHKAGIQKLITTEVGERQKQLLKLFNLSFINTAIGEYIEFGNYYQKSKDYKDVIDWLVLDVQDNKALLISKYALDADRYNFQEENITWSESYIRRFLNTTFINEAFNDEEQKQILLTHLDNPDNPTRGTSGGIPTEDKLFLVSIQEANKYFKSDAERRCKLTAYDKYNSVSIINNSCIWWLRSPGDDTHLASWVLDLGYIGDYGFSVKNSNHAVRVALWLNLIS